MSKNSQTDKTKKIVVLIDADNAQQSKISLILSELSSYGHIIVKKAYGDWSSSRLKNWSPLLNELVIQPVQQFSYTTGKNATDISMIIDAMDLLYSERFDAFALVSSDSDFTALASRLRESEIHVFGFGEKKTPISFRNACDSFIFTENLRSEEELDAEKEKHEFDKTLQEAVKILYNIWQKHRGDDGWVDSSTVGRIVLRLHPDFDARTYGSRNISTLIKSLKDYLSIRETKGKGTAIILDFKPNKKAKALMES